MAANVTPIFPLTPKVAFGTVLTADATASKNHDGTSSGAVLIFTAGSNGARVDEITALHLGTNVATALRIFINNGSDPTVAANNTLYKDVTAAANTISEVDGITPISIGRFSIGIGVTCGVSTVCSGRHYNCDRIASNGYWW